MYLSKLILCYHAAGEKVYLRKVNLTRIKSYFGEKEVNFRGKRKRAFFFPPLFIIIYKEKEWRKKWWPCQLKKRGGGFHKSKVVKIHHDGWMNGRMD